jgi:hypothetical protein
MRPRATGVTPGVRLCGCHRRRQVLDTRHLENVRFPLQVGGAACRRARDLGQRQRPSWPAPSASWRSLSYRSSPLCSRLRCCPCSWSTVRLPRVDRRRAGCRPCREVRSRARLPLPPRERRTRRSGARRRRRRRARCRPGHARRERLRRLLPPAARAVRRQSRSVRGPPRRGARGLASVRHSRTRGNACAATSGSSRS